MDCDRSASRPYDRRAALASIDAPMPFGAARVAMVKRMIQEQGLNTRKLPMEWADCYLLALRNAGLAEAIGVAKGHPQRLP